MITNPDVFSQDDFIKYIDKNEPELEYCRKCKTKHIPPGAPITLEDRDTCGSYLPEWFPADHYDKPWRVFKRLVDDMVYLDELSQGYTHKPNPDEPAWDLQFHEYSSKWRALGKRGGWWKCRNGEDATEVERDCHICHSETVAADRISDVRVKMASGGGGKLKRNETFVLMLISPRVLVEVNQSQSAWYLSTTTSTIIQRKWARETKPSFSRTFKLKDIHST
jgi:hypothetical protein